MSINLFIHLFIYCNELTDVIMKFEKSRPRRANGITLIKIQRPKNKESQGCKFQSESKSEGRRKPMSQLEDSQAERKFFLTQPCILFRWLTY